MTSSIITLAAAIALAQPPAAPGPLVPSAVEIEFAGPLFRGVAPRTGIRVTALDDAGETLEDFAESLSIAGVTEFESGQPVTVLGPFENGHFELENVTPASDGVTVTARDGATLGQASPSIWPGFLTLIPPALAIILALATRQVLLSLFCAVWIGALLAHGLDPLSALLRSADTYLVGSVASTGHAYIILFSLTLAGMVGIITATGGIRGIVEAISRYARSSRSGQLSTWFLGLLIFFDDYANSLIVGNTMRPFTDRVRISREKLSFLVDATAAPVATIGVISTWTAFQLGLIKDALPPDSGFAEPGAFFIQSIPYAFYSILMIVFVFLVAFTLRDFGPMRKAERRCRTTGAVLAETAQPLVDENLTRMAETSSLPPRWYNAAVPIACVVGFTLVGLIALWGTDEDAAYKALLWAALGASIIAGVMAIAQKQKLGEVISNWVDGVRALLLAIMILVLAWAVGAVCDDLHTGDYVASLTHDILSPKLLPALTFFTAGVIAFSTGTSYGTMAILVPIVLPLAFKLGADADLDPSSVNRIAFGTLAAILGGAVFGDHCSPISDTTVLSSMASGADHVDHVRTQLPYAVVVAGIGLPCYLLVGFGVPVFVTLAIGLTLVVAVFFGLTKPPPADEFESDFDRRDETRTG